jgi:hypothetical protein
LGGGTEQGLVVLSGAGEAGAVADSAACGASMSGVGQLGAEDSSAKRNCRQRGEIRPSLFAGGWANNGGETL